MENTIVIKEVQTKEGHSQNTGKPWRLYRIVGDNGIKYTTFDAALGQLAAGNIGSRAAIAFTQTDKGNNLENLTITGDAPAEPVRHKTSDGNTDWDLIGLHKTRCALWAAILSNSTFVENVSPQAAAAFARELVIAAEVDIFRRDPAAVEGDIPF